MPNAKLRVSFDANVLIAGARLPRWPFEVMRSAFTGAFDLVLAEQVIIEARRHAVVADPAAIGGRYCEDCGVAEIADRAEFSAGVRPYAVDPEHAEALWARSEELVGERFSLA